jgi:hypothetical protein
MMTRILSPESAVGIPEAALAPSPAVLAGKRLAVLDNRKPHARLLMETMARRIAERTNAEVALVTAKATAATPAEPDILRQLEAADLVITGSAD